MVLGCHAEILVFFIECRLCYFGGLQYLGASLAVPVLSVRLWSEEECSVVGK